MRKDKGAEENEVNRDAEQPGSHGDEVNKTTSTRKRSAEQKTIKEPANKKVKEKKISNKEELEEGELEQTSDRRNSTLSARRSVSPENRGRKERSSMKSKKSVVKATFQEDGSDVLMTLDSPEFDSEIDGSTRKDTEDKVSQRMRNLILKIQSKSTIMHQF